MLPARRRGHDGGDPQPPRRRPPRKEARFMSSRKYPRHLHIIAALALGGLALTPGHARADDDSEAQSVIVARGSGEVQVQPDSVHVDVGSEAQATTLDDARTQVSTAMTHVL